jgi:hypothetical protein
MISNTLAQTYPWNKAFSQNRIEAIARIDVEEANGWELPDVQVGRTQCPDDKAGPVAMVTNYLEYSTELNNQATEIATDITIAFSVSFKDVARVPHGFNIMAMRVSAFVHPLVLIHGLG